MFSISIANNNNNSMILNSNLHFIAISLSALCTAALVSWVLLSVGYGLDFIDEGFYLASIANPRKYPVSLSNFGLIYHPLYLIAGGNISLMRQANVLTTLVLAGALSWLVLEPVFRNLTDRALERLVLSAALASSSLAMLRLWLPTPSYNWLAFQSLMIVAIGVLLSAKCPIRRQSLGWMLIATGGWLAFMAKPTTAAMAGVSAMIYLVLSRVLGIRLVLVVGTMLVGLLIATAFLMDGSISVFVARFTVALERVAAYGMGNTVTGIFRLDPLAAEPAGVKVLALGSTILFVAACLASSARPAARWLTALVNLSCAAAILCFVFNVFDAPLDYGLVQQLFLPACGVAGAAFALFGRFILKQDWASSRQLPTAILCALLPVAFVLGTGNNYWFMGGLAGFFSLLAGVALIGRPRRAIAAGTVVLPFAFAGQLVAANQIFFGRESPYYQPGPLRTATAPVDLGRHGGRLLVGESVARAVDVVAKARSQAGFEDGTPMIDLTGISPGILHLLGASPTGQPWIIGNFPMLPGSNAVAADVLKSVSCDELSKAWLLLDPDGPFRFPNDLIRVFGADQAKDYEVASTFMKSDPLSAFAAARPYQLMRPTRPVQDAARHCEEAKLR